jgi:hypothetical protein
MAAIPGIAFYDRGGAESCPSDLGLQLSKADIVEDSHQYGSRPNEIRYMKQCRRHVVNEVCGPEQRWLFF